MRRAAIKNMLMALITSGLSTTRVPEARAMLSPARSLMGDTRYPERTSRIKCKGRRDSSRKSRSNRRKAAR
jgi:hypothetical protein